MMQNIEAQTLSKTAVITCPLTDKILFKQGRRKAVHYSVPNGTNETQQLRCVATHTKEKCK